MPWQTAQYPRVEEAYLKSWMLISTPHSVHLLPLMKVTLEALPQSIFQAGDCMECVQCLSQMSFDPLHRAIPHISGRLTWPSISMTSIPTSSLAPFASHFSTCSSRGLWFIWRRRVVIIAPQLAIWQSYFRQGFPCHAL